MRVDLALVTALCQSIFDPDLSIAATDPAAPTEPWLAAEALAVARAIPARKAEFQAGRRAARHAMAAMGVAGRAIPMAPDRAPVWPGGITGSISHTDAACVAVVGRKDVWASIGVDLEADSGLDATLIAQVCTPAERAWLDTQAPRDRPVMAKLIFSAKEASYKAQYPLGGGLFGFDALSVRVDRDATRFVAQFQSDQGSFAAGDTLEGQFAHAAGILVTGVALRHSGTAREREE
ncbi:4'-phosphopantetheinyl transferase [Sulfitobacter sp. S190]|uniref:4'-phosphopantetheinyl transferase family protein n=1 Tax=Sulfitobacter sp. S190 TaxID=2867022 RepID=UPI0021A7A58B|nr:4'-phosphopantetheinyl transferase superfamily protein [Sulfitobacter sp. S190]UWR23514.1 4'-phosphopantetheinyl transferase superfamily protein [Sulfitobacter sp. S190]